MRKINVGAIQHATLPIPDRCNCLSEKYTADADYIMGHNILRQSEVTLGLLEKAGEMGLDIVTTGEDICAASPYIIDTSERNLFPELAGRSAAFVAERISGIAEKYHMYVVACYMKPHGGKIYNTATIFDRKGGIVGEYRKTHLPPDEKWQVAEGESVEVFDLEFGRVGIEICYDMMFPELSGVLSLKGAEIVFHPTAGYGWYDSIGEATLRARANDGSFYLVTAKNYVFNSAGRSGVIDFWGQILADAGFYKNVVAAKEIDLDFPKTQLEWHYQTGMSGEPDLRKRKPGERRPGLYRPLCENTERGKITSPEKQREIFQSVRDGVFHW